jgi:hypothetical protein
LRPGIASSACSASSASPHTVKSPSPLMTCAKPSRKTGWSSTMNTLRGETGVRPLAGESAEFICCALSSAGICGNLHSKRWLVVRVAFANVADTPASPPPLVIRIRARRFQSHRNLVPRPRRSTAKSSPFCCFVTQLSGDHSTERPRFVSSVPESGRVRFDGLRAATEPRAV